MKHISTCNRRQANTIPYHRPRPLTIWKQNYKDDVVVPDTVDKLVPTIYGTLDLVIFRLHTASGYPKEILHHAYYQMTPWGSDDGISAFDRIGIEWNPLWATTEGRKELCEEKISWAIYLMGNKNAASAQLYWLVDGIPRPQWNQYPPAIPTAFSRVIEKRKSSLLRYWNTDQAWKDRLLKHHDLNQEFEANGRRYYVVFVIAEFTSEYCLEESFLDPDVSWDGPFPGGEDIWPGALREPVRVASKLQDSFPTDRYCSYILSWEPI